MRPAALLSLCAFGGSVMAQDFTSQLADLTDLPSSFLANANPTSLLHSATAALHTLSEFAATATGEYGSILRSEQTSLASYLSNAQASASAALNGNMPNNNNAASTGATGSSTGMAAATGVPVLAAGALAALALL